MGGYFQLGEHRAEDQLAVRNYVDTYLTQNLGVYQASGQPAYLMTCLALGQRHDYRKWLEQQLRDLKQMD